MRIGFKWHEKEYSPEELIKLSKGDPLFPFSEPILLLLKDLTMTERDGIHVTSLTSPCDRKTWLERHVDYYSTPQELMGLVIGTLAHAMLERGDGLTELELQADANGITVLGRLDRYVPEMGVIEDYKTTRWLTPHKTPYGEHARQVNVYAWLLRENGYEPKRAIVRYIDMSGPSKCDTCRIPLVDSNEALECPRCHKFYSKETHHLGVYPAEIELDPPEKIFEWVSDRAATLSVALTNDEPPDPKRTWLCNYCSFRRECWG